MELGSLRSRLRQFAEKIRPANLEPLTPPVPSGRDFERFRDPAYALTAWPDKQTQWWYFTGNVTSRCGRRFGYELVFFTRRTDLDYIGVLPSHWLKQNIAVAHFALADIDNPNEKEQFRYWHRGGVFSNATGFASMEFFHVEQGGWSAYQDDLGIIHLRAESEGRSITLQLNPLKDLVYHGKGGYSQRDEDCKVASYHCTYTRLETKGRIVLNKECFEVSGLSWMDHEKMLAGRERFIHGWDWYSIQLDNKEELMIYHLRKEDSSFDEKYSSGTHVDAHGKLTHLTFEDFQVKILGRWKSPKTGGKYPNFTEVTVPSLGIKLEVVPLVPHSELDCVKTSFVTYWEGPIRTIGHIRDQAVKGSGYLELCGYDERKSSQLVHSMIMPEPHF